MTYEKIVDYVQKKMAKVDAAATENLAVQVDVTGEGEGAFYIAVCDGKLDVEPYEYYDHDAKIVVDSSDLIDIVDGKLDAAKAFNEGKIRVEGNVEKFISIKALFPAAAPAKKAEAKPAAKKAPAKKAPAKKAPAKKAEEKKTEEKKTEVKKEEPKKEAAPKAAAKPAAKKAPAKKK